MHLPLNALRAFEAAARLRSVSQAAAELHVTHGAVSRQLRALEEELGLVLFERDGRGIRPNAAGHRLLEATSGAFSQLRDCISSLRRPQRTDAFVLGRPGSLLARWMIPRLQDLQRDLPGLTLHLAAQDGDFAPRLHPQFGVEIGERLVEQEDAGLAHDRPPDGDALALAAGQFVGLVVGPRFQADGF